MSTKNRPKSSANYWTSPTIVRSVRLPQLMLSRPPLLIAFSRAAYAVVAGQPFDAVVTVTDVHGNPVADQHVQVALPVWATWPDLSIAPRTFRTDDSGEALITGITSSLLAHDGPLEASLPSGEVAWTRLHVRSADHLDADSTSVDVGRSTAHQVDS